MGGGWRGPSTGQAGGADDPSELDQLTSFRLDPWPGGHREAIIRIETTEISGRTIHQENSG